MAREQSLRSSDPQKEFALSVTQSLGRSSALFYSFWIWSSSYECRVRQAVHSYDMLWPPYCFCVEKLHIIKVNISVLDKPLYQKMVLWSWSLSRVSSSESLKGSCNVLPLWTTASTQENSDFPCIFQIPSFPLSFIEEKDPGRSLQQGHIRLIKPLKE